MHQNIKYINALILITLPLIGLLFISAATSKKEIKKFYCGRTISEKICGNMLIEGYRNEYLDSLPTKDSIIIGESLFQNYCTACHYIDRELIGPSLKQVVSRREKNWIIAFIKDSQNLIESGDSTAIQLYNQYYKTEMPPIDLRNDELEAIYQYLKFENEYSQR